MKRISGLTLDGSTAHMIIGRTEVPIINASYGDNLTPEKLRELGRQDIRALTPGTYDTEEGKIEIARDVLSTILIPAVAQYGFGNQTYPLLFAFVHPVMGADSDYIEGCRLTKLQQALDNSNKVLTVPIGLMYSQIYWTDMRRTINALDTSQPLTSSRL